jgi:hypothetical protein
MMELADAIKTLSRYTPCPHENYNTKPGDGATWGKCNDCGETFFMENLPRRRQVAEDFEAAMCCLCAIAKDAGLRDLYLETPRWLHQAIFSRINKRMSIVNRLRS